MDEILARSAFEHAIENYKEDFGTFFLALFLGLDISYEDEVCKISFPVRDFLFNPQGSLHGGVIATVMDISMGHLLRHSYGRGGATVEMKIQYLRAVTVGPARCTGRFIKRGRNLAFLESQLVEGSGMVAAVDKSTWMCGSREPATPEPAIRG